MKWTRVADLKPFTVDMNVRARIVSSERVKEVTTKHGRTIARQRLEIEDPEGGPRIRLVLWGADAGRFRLGNVIEVRAGRVNIYGRTVELALGHDGVRLAPRSRQGS